MKASTQSARRMVIKPRQCGKTFAGPFSAYGFTTIRSDAHLQRDGQHFMTVNTLEGAQRLAAILNMAAALAAEPGAIGNEPNWSARKIVHAVATALGVQIDFSAERAA